MNLEDEKRALRKANQDLRVADERIQAQVKLIEELGRDGHDIAQARRLLTTMRESRQAMAGHRERIIEAIDLLERAAIKGAK